MRSSSNCRAAFLFLAAACLLLSPGPACPGTHPLSFAEMARSEAVPTPDARMAQTLHDGYRFLGLRRDAAAFVEERLSSGAMTPAEAGHAFEALLADAEKDHAHPDEVLPIAEAALRNGIRTGPVLYASGTALLRADKLPEAKALLSEIAPGDPLHPRAIFVLGQIAAREGRFEDAAFAFAGVRERCGTSETLVALSRRATLAQAQATLLSGKREEAASLFRAVLETGDVPEARAGLRVALDACGDEARFGLRMTGAGGDLRQRIRHAEMEAVRARNRGRFEDAEFFLSDAKASADRIAMRAASPDFDPDGPTAFEETHRRVTLLLDGLRSRREADACLDLLVGFLLQGRLAAGENIATLSREEAAEAFDRLERGALGGKGPEEIAASVSRRVDTLGNMAHPIERYRLLSTLERQRARILGACERAREMRREASAELERAQGRSARAFLASVGRVLEALANLRSLSEEADMILREGFDIFANGDGGNPGMDARQPEFLRGTLAFERAASDRIARAVAESAVVRREAARAREMEEVAALRKRLAGREAETLISRARALREAGTLQKETEALDLARKAAAFLHGDRLGPSDRARVAVRLGFLLSMQGGRWVPLQGTEPADEWTGLLPEILPELEKTGGAGGDAVDAAWLAIRFRMLRGEPDAFARAREFVQAHPGSPRSADLAYLLAAGMINAGKVDEAVPLLREAANEGAGNASEAAHALLGWLRLRAGDPAGAATELAAPLSDPDAFCGELSSFGQDALAMGTRAWRELPLDGLAEYPPVREGRCGGRRLLEVLGETEEKRGEPGRAWQAFETLLRKFPGHEAAPAYEAKRVEEMVRTGRVREAVPAVLELAERFEPASDAWKGTRPDLRERFRKSLLKTLEPLSEKRFGEGIRHADREALSEAAAMMGHRLRWEEGESGGRAELRLRHAVATIRTGSPAEGHSLLKEISEEPHEASFAARAAFAWAEEAVAAYGRGELWADDAREAVLFLLRTHPSGRAARLALQAATLMAPGEGEDSRPAGTLAEDVAACPEAPPSVVAEARLLLARSALAQKRWKAARRHAEAVPATRGVAEEAHAHAAEMYTLAALREAEEEEGQGRGAAAAALFEALADRYPQDPASPEYRFRALALFRSCGDADNAVRLSRSILRKLPPAPGARRAVEETGAFLEARGEPLRAADLYEEACGRMSPGKEAGEFLFRAGLLAAENGRTEEAVMRFARYRAKQPASRGRAAYAFLFVGLAAVEEGDGRRGIREIEEGIAHLDAGAGADAPPPGLPSLSARARLALGKARMEEFRRCRLSSPLERSMAAKERLFRRAFDLFRRVADEGPRAQRLEAARLSGDLLVAFGKDLLSSPRPKGLSGADRGAYEKALSEKARAFIERGLEYYAAAMKGASSEEGAPEPAGPVGERIAEARALVTGLAGEAVPR